MQRRTRLACLATISLIAGTTAASAQAYDWNGNPVGWDRGGYAYETGPMYTPGPAAPYGTLNGSNHPAPSSTQGDVGPGGNNNGTLTGPYRSW
ncbi:MULTISPECIES: hypothetical protein [Bradyrhizobium]|uniref:Uncharacterized protein n=1 Tax=Bradyrhizobium neotropicale TaxID=1497615 RepID=A0A176Z249_9BRAD|nr:MULTISPECIES: hypothetical protein [Bradyrhizobium]OAF14158.1 hypothetical protein AXW67_00760 [Bradyrhizobium neotropicale]